VTAEGDRLTGAVSSVADALAADVVLVPTGDGLYAVDAAGPGVKRAPVVSLDLTRRLCDLTLRDAPARLLASGAAAAAVDAGLTAGAGLLASEQVGLAQWCLESTVEYVKVRHQFGRPVGSFQALKHRLADMWVNLTQARAVARYAAACLADRDPDTPVAVALAQAHCAPIAVSAAEECVQMHGGLGFTWEHPAHLYLKRAKADAIAFGSADRHRAALASLLDLPAAAR
jgi:alkylation response protein AidB-like acyl-CoA dehydrogenase